MSRRVTRRDWLRKAAAGSTLLGLSDVSFLSKLKSGERVSVEAPLQRWFSPRSRGWLCGDNHVHAQHDAKADVKTDCSYAALQAPSDGLDFITENGSVRAKVGAAERLSRPDFLMM